MNKEFLGERRRGLEEKYFAKLNRALIESLRAAEAAAGKVRDAGGRSEEDGDASPGRHADSVRDGRRTALRGFDGALRTSLAPA